MALFAIGFIGPAAVHGAIDEPAAGKSAIASPPDWMKGKDLRPTYNGGVALIYEHRCVGCHRPGEVAPMSFVNYADVRKWETGTTNTPLESLLQTRAMPPWPAHPNVGEFSNSLFLTKPEMDLLLAWIQAGFPRGEGTHTPRERIEGWNIGKPDHVIELPKHRLAADVYTEVREFTIETNFAEDRWIIAAEARPGNPGLVVGIDGGPLGSYRIGNTFVQYPAGTGRLLRAGAKISVRVSYAKTRRAAASDESRLGVVFAKDVPVAQKDLREEFMPVADFVIPPGAEKFPVTTRFQFPADGQIYSLMPVMNLRGKDVLYTAIFPDGSRKPLLSIPQWDPMWKYRYQLKSPLAAPKGTIIEALAHFDNSEANIRNPNPHAEVRSGPGGEVFESWISYWVSTDTNPDASCRQP
jgi:hypothetical protein